MEVLLSGLAVCGAVVFTNPLDVIKTRLQLQGELKQKGTYEVHYRNLFQAVLAIVKADGVFALQRGLIPALYYQFVANGCRLGIYQSLDNTGIIRNDKGQVITSRSLFFGGLSGAIGTFIGSPFYMVKIQIQSRSSVAIGFQHHHQKMFPALCGIYRKGGIPGLWRGVGAAMSRSTVGSAAQLATFSKSKSLIENLEVLEKSNLMIPFLAACLAGLAIGLVMTPFDVVATRLYNQGNGKYRGMLHCFGATLGSEGIGGLYKGLSAQYIRNGPHTVLTLMFWFQIHEIYYSYINKKSLSVPESG